MDRTVQNWKSEDRFLGVSRRAAFPYLLLAPSMLAFAVLLGWPILKSVMMSFQYYVLTRPERGTPFVGFHNYIDAFSRPEILNSIWLAVIYTTVSVAATMAIGLVTALALREDFFGRGFFRAAVIIPWVVPPVVTALVWVWMLDYQFGVVNFLLSEFGLIDAPLGWLTDGRLAMVSMIMVGTWKEYPIATLMLLAGLQNIPIDSYEASSIDGANAWQRFRHITLPGLKPVLGILTLLEVIWSFKSFTYIYVMTEGGPARATQTVVVEVYMQAFRNFNFGLASAVGVIMFVIMLIFSLVYLRLIYGSGYGAGEEA